MDSSASRSRQEKSNWATHCEGAGTGAGIGVGRCLKAKEYIYVSDGNEIDGMGCDRMR
jgi:hypothetical protein